MKLEQQTNEYLLKRIEAAINKHALREPKFTGSIEFKVNYFRGTPIDLCKSFAERVILNKVKRE